MKNSLNKILCFICFLIMVGGCQSSPSGKVPENGVLPVYRQEEAEKLVAKDMENFRQKISAEYEVKKIELNSISQMGGILAGEKEVLIADQGNNCIFQLDNSGEIINKIGEKGDGPLQFSCPGRMTYYKEKIYIIDQDNFRVQVLDRDMKFEKTIPVSGVNGKNPKFRKQHLAVNEKGLFLSNSTQIMPGSDRGIEFYPSDDGSFIFIATEFSGPLVASDKILYAVNSMVSAPERTDGTDGSLITGPGWIFEYTGDQNFIEPIAELPSGINICDMTLENNNMIVFSCSVDSLMKFDLKGNYLETIARFEPMPFLEIFLSSDKEGSYWIGFQEDNSLYHIYKKI